MQIALPGIVGHCDVMQRVYSSLDISRSIENLRRILREAIEKLIEQYVCVFKELKSSV